MSKLTELICYKDGGYSPLLESGPSLMDFGFIHSDATYDVMTIKNGKLFLFELHLDRFQSSAAFYGLKVPESTEILAICEQVCKINNIIDGFVWLISWRGTPADGNPRNFSGCPHHFVVYAKPYYNFNSSNSARVALYKDHVRVPDECFGQQYKNFAWQDLTLAQRYAYNRGYDTAILCNREGNITEGPGFAVGFVINDIITIPNKDVLHSVTIGCLKQICSKQEIFVAERNISWQESLECDGMFLASTSGGFISVTEYEDRKLPQHKIVQILQDEYRLLQDS